MRRRELADICMELHAHVYEARRHRETYCMEPKDDEVDARTDLHNELSSRWLPENIIVARRSTA